MTTQGRRAIRFYQIFTTLLLGLSLIGAIVLVKRNQDIRNRATGCPWYAKRDQCPSSWNWDSGDCQPNGDCCCRERAPDPTAAPGVCTIRYNGTCFTVTNCAGKDIQGFSKDYSGTTDTSDQGTCMTTANPEGIQKVPDNNPHTYCADPQSCRCRQIDHHFGGDGVSGPGGVCACKACPVVINTPTPPVNTNTPTATPTTRPTSTPTPPLKSCDAGCTTDSQCASGFCYSWMYGRNCRNRSCGESANCICPVDTPTPTATPTTRPTPTPTTRPTPTPTTRPTPTPFSKCDTSCGGPCGYREASGQCGDYWGNVSKCCHQACVPNTSSGTCQYIPGTGTDNCSKCYPVSTNTPTPTETPVPTETPTPSNTPTPGRTYSCNCTTVKLYNQEWNEISPSTVVAGQVIYISVRGWKDYPVYNIDKGRLRVNKNNWSSSDETNQIVPNQPGEFYITYTVPGGGGSFKVEGEIHLSGPEPGGRWQ